MKTKKFRAGIGLLLALCLLTTSAAAAVNPGNEIQPMYAGISLLMVSGDISSSGYALGDVQANLSNSSYSAKVSLSLQRSDNGRNYETIYTWTKTGSNVVLLEKGRYVLSGYYYRFLGVVYVYDASGSLFEIQSSYSGVMYY